MIAPPHNQTKTTSGCEIFVHQAIHWPCVGETHLSSLQVCVCVSECNIFVQLLSQILCCSPFVPHDGRHFSWFRRLWGKVPGFPLWWCVCVCWEYDSNDGSWPLVHLHECNNASMLLMHGIIDVVCSRCLQETHSPDRHEATFLTLCSMLQCTLCVCYVCSILVQKLVLNGHRMIDNVDPPIFHLPPSSSPTVPSSNYWMDCHDVLYRLPLTMALTWFCGFEWATRPQGEHRRLTTQSSVLTGFLPAC